MAGVRRGRHYCVLLRPKSQAVCKIVHVAVRVPSLLFYVVAFHVACLNLFTRRAYYACGAPRVFVFVAPQKTPHGFSGVPDFSCGVFWGTRFFVWRLRACSFSVWRFLARDIFRAASLCCRVAYCGVPE